MACITINEARVLGRKCCKTLLALKQWMNGRHPSFRVGTCFTSQAVGGSAQIPIHATGRALDVYVRSPRVQANKDAMWAVVNGLVALNCSLGIQRIYWDNHYWNANLPIGAGPAGWKALAPWQRKQNPYTDHAHIEVSSAFANTLTYNNVLSIIGTSITVPGGKNDPPYVAPPVPSAPPVPPGLALTDTTGKWTRDQLLLSASAVVGDDATKVTTSVICGGRGGYAVNTDTGIVCAAGLAPFHGNLGGAILDFLPYGDGYYALMADGIAINGFGPDASVVPVFTPCLYSAPWQSISSPVSGVIVATKTTTRMAIEQCAASVTDLSLTNSAGPCC
jgi:hypothetical protein